VLCWVIHAWRPLNVAKILEALAVRLGDEKLDRDNSVFIDETLVVCAVLVTVNKESSVIWLLHYTTEDFFRNTRANWVANASTTIAVPLLTYLNFQVFSKRVALSYDEIEDMINDEKLFIYVVKNWGFHAFLLLEQKCAIWLSSCLLMLASLTTYTPNSILITL
jgi:hypothetical protein